jgi:hypothetical protein
MFSSLIPILITHHLISHHSFSCIHHSRILLRMLSRLLIFVIKFVFIVFIILAFIFVCFETVAFLEGGEGLDMGFETGVCEAFYDALFKLRLACYFDM